MTLNFFFLAAETGTTVFLIALTEASLTSGLTTVKG
jgi:hypothetical protein